MSQIGMPMPMPPMHPGVMGYSEAMSQFSVNRDGWEAIKYTLYDTATYPAAGTNELKFFTVPLGQGSNWYNSSLAKTLSDTNMDLAGQLPANKSFLIQGVEVQLFTATPSVSGALPAAYGAQAIAGSVNDAYVFRRSGHFDLTIGSKSYISESPLAAFPGKTRFHVEAALSDISTTGASMQSRIATADVVGRPYSVQPNIFLISTQNFNVTLSWPEGVQTINNPAKIMVKLDGILYRKSQ